MKLLKNNKPLKTSLIIPNYIGYFGKFLEFFSVKLASFFAIKLFTTPVSFPLPKREHYMLKSAQIKRLMVDEINKEIEIISYGYSKKKVMLVHGWSGRGTQLYAFADKLLENGYMVISFDGPAHGNSSGTTTMMPDFLETIKKDEVQALDLALEGLEKEELKNKLLEIEELKKEIKEETKVPLSYMGEYYDLIMHLELIISKVNIKINSY